MSPGLPALLLVAALGDGWSARVDFHAGLMRLELEGLEAQLQDLGYGRSRRHYVTLGLGGRIGKGGVWLVAETSILARDALGGDEGAPFTGFGLLGAGLTVVELEHFELTPRIALGAARARFSAEAPETEARVPLGATAALVSVDADAQFVLPIAADRSVQLGLRAGYVFALAHTGWTLEGGQRIDAGSNARFSGPRFEFTVGGALSLGD